MQQLISYCCLLCSLSSIVRSRGNLFQRNRDFDNLSKEGFATTVYNVSGSGPCGIYATGFEYHSFFFNEITHECRLMYETLSDVAGAVSYPGNRYFVKPLGSTTQMCSTADGFTLDPTSGLCYKVTEISTSWTDAKSQCGTYGYQLIVLDTLTKAQTLADMITASPSHTNDGYWIGLSDSTGWVDGSALTDTNWRTTGQTLQSDQCVRLDRSNGYKWVNDHCNSARGYICQAV